MEKHLKKAKTWNTVVIILGILSVATGVMGLPKVLNPNAKDYEMLGDYGRQMLDYMNSPLTKAVSVLSLVVSIVLLVFYFKANKKLSDEIAPSKVPDYVSIGWSLLSLALSLITQPTMQIEGTNINTIMTIVMTVFQVIFLLPALLVIVHLFKAEPEE